MIVICLYYILSLNGWYNVFNINLKVKIVFGNVFEFIIFFRLFLKNSFYIIMMLIVYILYDKKCYYCK